MAGRAKNGVEIDLDKVPRRAKRMTPYEILLSESQERKHLVARPGKEAEVLAICKKWELDAAIIGKVTDTGRWVVKATPGYDPLLDPPSKANPIVACDLPVEVLTDAAPVYDRPRAELSPRAPLPPIPVPGDYGKEILDALASPNIGSRRWIWSQYDHVVRGGTVVRPGSDAGIVRVPCEKDGKTIEKLLAFAVDCNGRHVELDPFTGGAMAVAEVCRNLVVSGAEPIGITDCLNFGNPERPEVMETFARAIDGLAAACAALGVPIVSGNVSLYNETDGKAILPTPTVAAVGLVHAREHVVTQCFKRPGDVVLLVGDDTPGDLGGSEYLCRKTGQLGGKAPRFDLEAERKLQTLVLGLAQERKLQSAHDVSDGGLAVALAECTLGPEGVGARIDLDAPEAAEDTVALFFGETPSRVIISVAAADVGEVTRRANAAGVPVHELGVTGGDSLSVALAGRHGELVKPVVVAVSALREAHESALRSIVGD
jgi:phosphoribosylformylglycinamidine synthase